MKTNLFSESEVLASMFVLDAPVPERNFYSVLGGRMTFAKWAAAGLPRYRIDGIRGPAVKPKELKAFLEKQKVAI